MNRALEQLGETPRGAGGTIALHRAVADLTIDLLRDRRRDPLRRRVRVVHATAGTVTFEAVADVEVLLEVVRSGK